MRVIVTRPSDDPVAPQPARADPDPCFQHGAPACHETFKKELEVNGVGYRVSQAGQEPRHEPGLSHIR